MNNRTGYWTGRHLTDEMRKKISNTLMGNIPWNKNKKTGQLTPEHRQKISDGNKGKVLSPETKRKISESEKGKIVSEETCKKLRNRVFSKELYPTHGWRSSRRYQIFPKKDTTIEVKIQNYLKDLGIEFYTHQYMKEIKHGYQCDVFIPVQDGIDQKTIIECDGDYWHHYPDGTDDDHIRTKELIEQGFRVIRLWEREIKLLSLNDFKTQVFL